MKPSEDEVSADVKSNEKGTSNSVTRNTVQRIGRPPAWSGEKGSISDLTKLYKEQSNEKNK